MGGNNSKKVSPVDVYSSRNEVLALNGKIINLKKGGWYNLGTNRENINLPAGVLFDEKYKVFGTSGELEGFYYRNHITTNLVCNPNVLGSVVYAPNTEDIEKVPQNYLDNLCEFNLIGLQTKGKITSVRDGDTIDIAFYVKLSYLFNHRPNLEEPEGKHQQVSVLKSVKPESAKVQDSGLFIKMRARLANIDSAEKATKQGKLAMEMMDNLYKETNYIVYARMQEMDKYGRVLIDLYKDPEYKKYLNYYLINNPDPKLGVLAVRYAGDTKSEYMKNLQTF